MRILPDKLIPFIVLLLASALCYSTVQAAAFPAQFDPRRMSADEGWLFTGTKTESAMGGVALGIGDINGDGYTDFIIGTGPYTESPAHYLVYGNPAGYDTVLPARGSDAEGRVYLSGLLRFVRLGDINGDGLDDFIIFDTWNGSPEQVYVVFGAGTSLPPLIDTDTLDGSNGLWIANNRTGGLEEGVREFSDISLVRDSDGDGVDDLLVGTRSEMENTQLVYVVPGRSEWPSP